MLKFYLDILNCQQEKRDTDYCRDVIINTQISVPITIFQQYLHSTTGFMFESNLCSLPNLNSIFAAAIRAIGRIPSTSVL